MYLNDVMEWSTEAVRVAYPDIINHMQKETPIEAVGWLWSDGTISKFVNQARATDRFAIGHTQMAEALAANPPEEKLLVGLYHSHPNGLERPSVYDEEQMRLQFVSGLPFPWIIVTPNCNLTAWFFCEPDGIAGLQIFRPSEFVVSA